MSNTFSFGLSKTFIVQLFIIVLNIVQSVVINRTLIPADKGIYAIIMQSLNIFVALLQFGQPEVMLHYFSTKKNIQNRYFTNLTLIILISFIVSSVVLVLLLISKSEILSALGHKELLPFIFSFILSFNLLIIFYQRIIQLNGYLNNFNYIILFQNFIWLLSIILSINIIDNKLYALFIASLTSLLISSIATIIILFNNLNIRIKFDFYLLKASMIEGFKMQIGLVASIIGTQLGIFILASKIDNESAGIYSVSIGLVNMLLIVPNSIRIVFQSRANKYLALYKSVEVQTLITFKLTFILMVFFCIIFIVLGKDIVFFLYGVNYVPSYEPSLILLFYIIFRSLGSSFGTYFGIEKQFWFSSKSIIVTVIINFLLSLHLSKNFGIYGVALATSVSWFIWFIIHTTKYLKMTKTKANYLIPKVQDIKQFYSLFINL